MITMTVDNLDFDPTIAEDLKEEIRQIFARYGEVCRIHLPTDRETGQLRGFARVDMNINMKINMNPHLMTGETKEGVIAASKDDYVRNMAFELNGHELRGRCLRIRGSSSFSSGSSMMLDGRHGQRGHGQKGSR